MVRREGSRVWEARHVLLIHDDDDGSQTYLVLESERIAGLFLVLAAARALDVAVQTEWQWE